MRSTLLTDTSALALTVVVTKSELLAVSSSGESEKAVAVLVSTVPLATSAPTEPTTVMVTTSLTAISPTWQTVPPQAERPLSLPLRAMVALLRETPEGNVSLTSTD